MAQKRKSRKKKSTRSKGPKVSAKDLLDLLPEELLERLSDETGVDRHVSRLKGKLLFTLLLFGIMEEDRLSEQVLVDLYASEKFKRFSGKGDHETAKSSLSDRFSSIKVEYFEEIFTAFKSTCNREYRRFLSQKTDLLRFDSTMIAIGAGLIEKGMQVGRKAEKGNGKKQIKVTVGLCGDIPDSAQVFMEQSHLSEETALKESIEKSELKQDKIIVFDRGLKSRKTFEEFNGDGVDFVTRGAHSVRYETVRVHSQIKGRSTDTLLLKEDLIVHLYTSGKNKTEQTFRLVSAIRKENGLPIYFLTNMLDPGAKAITEIYKRRWDIEVFFRFIKQELGFENLISLNENGIKVMVFVRLTLAIMLQVYRMANKLEGYKRAKFKFKLELQMQIMNMMVLLSGGDLSKLDDELFDYKGFM